MSIEINLGNYSKVSNSNGLLRVTGVREDNIRCDVGLRIRKIQSGGTFDFTLFGPAIDAEAAHESGVSGRSTKEIFALAEDCRSEWEARVVGKSCVVNNSIAGKNNYYPFQDTWDFSEKKDLLNEAGPYLARAGNKLFKLIFYSNSDYGLKQLGQVLSTVLSSEPRYMAITSDDFFLPWGVLYTHPVGHEDLSSDGSNWRKEGFWGYRHIVQQAPEKCELESRIRPINGKVDVSINYDEGLSHDLKIASIDQHFQYIRTLCGIECRERTTKLELEKCFTDDREELERILYFYCHGNGGKDGEQPNLKDTHLVMTDDTVSGYDFQLWASDRPLPTNPLFFINACQGGQMTTLFYQTLAAELLKEKAVGLIGAQIDMPAIFAAEYGKRLFSNFLVQQDRRIRLGPLLREINQQFWDNHCNPLGLSYSLYRGVDCFVEWDGR